MKPVNLVPAELRVAPEPPRAPMTSGPPAGFVVLVGLALVLVATVAYVLAANAVDRRRADLTAAKAELAATQTAAASLQGPLATATRADATDAEIRTLADRRVAWDTRMRQLSVALPRAARLSTIDASATTGAGDSSGGVRAALDVPAMVLSGCVRDQGDIPDVLSRLRDLPKATRVVLSSSADDDQAAGGSGCRRARSPKFEVTVFFGDAPAPGGDADAAATAATATATATATPAATATATAGATP